jgi:hypothetical protein
MNQAKGLRILAVVLVLAGLTVGVGLPVLFIALDIPTAIRVFGIDLVFIVAFAVMIADFVLAWHFWRRASAIS